MNHADEKYHWLSANPVKCFLLSFLRKLKRIDMKQIASDGKMEHEQNSRQNVKYLAVSVD